MRKEFIAAIASLVLALPLRAQDSKLSLLIDAGPTFITEPQSGRDATPWGLLLEAELSYRLCDHWSIVPLSLSNIRLSVDKGERASQLGGLAKVSDATASLFTLAPAIQFNTDPERSLMWEYQLGGGWAHTMANVKGSLGGTSFDTDNNGDHFMLFLSAGLEGHINERFSLLGRVKYWTAYMHDDMSGLNVGLGLRIHY